MKAEDFRIGNYINYRIIDELDERKTWLELSEIDPSDLRILQNKHEINQDYQPIEITEKWLIKLGFVKKESEREFFYGDMYEIEMNSYNCWFCVYKYSINETGYNANGWKMYMRTNHHKQIKFIDILKMLNYIHDLQNLYYCLSDIELKLKK